MANRDIVESLKSQISAMESAGFQPKRAGASKKGGNRQNAKGPDAPHLEERGVSPDEEGARALKKIVALVNVSERSESGVRERLARDGFSQQAIDEAVARALDYGYIDDMRYASTLIRSRLSQGKGAAGIRRELAQHDIDIDDVPGWPFEFEVEEQDEESRALAYLESHPPRSKNKRDGAYRKLAQRGFSSSVASRVARMWAEKEV